jgi:hypothetical protein
MTTEVVRTDLRLPWDYFLTEDSFVLDHPEAPRARSHIEAFREFEWPAILRQLASEPFAKGDDGSMVPFEVPEGLEPHWVYPGKAVLWRHQVISRGVPRHDENGDIVIDEDGSIVRTLVETDGGWRPTLPLPVANASQLAAYLNKGFRLRPPASGVDVEAYREVHEAAATQEATEVKQVEEEADRERYACLRHRQGRMEFNSWRSYIRHCENHKELPNVEPPDYVLDRVRRFKWYCLVHNKGWNNHKRAQMHIQQEMRKPNRAYHAALSEMEVKQGRSPAKEG